MRDPRRSRRCATGAATRARSPGPFEAWLAHRSLRHARRAARARVRNALRDRRGCCGARTWPPCATRGCRATPAHEVARRQMSGFGTVVSFDLGATRARRALPRRAPSWSPTPPASAASTPRAERRARWGGDDVPEGFIRLSARAARTPPTCSPTWSGPSTRDAARHGRERLPGRGARAARRRPRRSTRASSCSTRRAVPRGFERVRPVRRHPHRLPCRTSPAVNSGGLRGRGAGRPPRSAPG